MSADDVVVTPAFVSTVPDTGSPTKVGPNAWNAARKFDGGTDGDAIVRDSTATNGARWAALGGGGGGGGTEYTEDTPAVANPVGPIGNARRRDALVSEVSDDGDVITVNATAKGEVYVKHVDALPITSATLATAAAQATLQTAIDAIKVDVDKIPSQGQALAAASTPVVLTAIQAAALTPPAAITGFATSAKQDTAQTALDAIKTDVDKIPSQGQALAAASTPVVLTAIQVTALTPPAAITGFALEAGHAATIDTSTAATAAAAGVTTGAKVVTDATGTIQQYLRGLVTFFANALGAGTAAAAIRHTLASDDPAVATLGATTGAKVITDATGTIQQYLRGLIYQSITAGAFLVTMARKFFYGAVVTLTTTNFAGLTNTSGWQSAAIATGGAAEIQFLFETLGAAGSTLLVDFYLAEAFTSGSFTDGATGTEGTFTAANRKNSRYIGSLQCNTTTTVRGMIKYTDVSGSLAERVALLAINNSGGTISATGGNTVFGYELIN